MENEEKAKFYNFLLAEHTKLGNQIQLVMAENVNLNSEQEHRIKVLKQKQLLIMQEVERLMM